MTTSSKRVRAGTVWWVVKLHPSSAELVENESPKIAGHIVLRIEGKERPAIVLGERQKKYGGKRHFEILFSTTKAQLPDGRPNNDLMPVGFLGEGSHLEFPATVISENLVTRHFRDLHEQTFRELVKGIELRQYQLYVQKRKS